jgi:molecular chaperone GrpE
MGQKSVEEKDEKTPRVQHFINRVYKAMSSKNNSESAAPAHDNELAQTAESSDEMEQAEVVMIDDEQAESDFKVSDKRYSTFSADDETADEVNALDAYEIDLDKINFEDDGSDEIKELRAKIEARDQYLQEIETRLKDTESRREEAVRMSEEYADRFRKAQLMVKAEADEMRQRMQRTFDQRLEVSRGDVVASVLDTLDNLQRAIMATEQSTDQGAAFDSLRDGIKATAEMLEATLIKMGLAAVVSEGETFNPEVHEAVEIAATDADQDNQVLAELQRGYTFNGRLLRPARVKVGRAS